MPCAKPVAALVSAGALASTAGQFALDPGFAVHVASCVASRFRAAVTCVTSTAFVAASASRSRAGLVLTFPPLPRGFTLNTASLRALTNGTSTPNESRLLTPASSRIGVTCVYTADVRLVRPRFSVKALLPVSVRSAPCTLPSPGNCATPSVSVVKSKPSASRREMPDALRPYRSLQSEMDVPSCTRIVRDAGVVASSPMPRSGWATSGVAPTASRMNSMHARAPCRICSHLSCIGSVPIALRLNGCRRCGEPSAGRTPINLLPSAVWIAFRSRTSRGSSPEITGCRCRASIRRPARSIA